MKGHSKSKCCTFKIILAVLVFTLIAWGSGFLVWSSFAAGWNTEALKAIWRPMTAEHWHWMPAAYLLQGIIFVCVYSCLGCGLAKCIPCPFMRGAFFGFKIWLIGPFVGSIFWFISENITTDVVLIALASQFLAFVVGGAFASKVLGNPSCDDGSSCDTEAASCGTESKGSCHTGKNGCGGKNHCGANG